jgi:hypothetical protein
MAISNAVFAQEFNDVNFWLEKTVPSSTEFQSPKIERFMPKNDLAQFSLDLNLNYDNRLLEFSTFKPHTSTVLFDKSFNWKPIEWIAWDNKRYGYVDFVNSYRKGSKDLDIEMNYKLNRKLSLDFFGTYTKYPTISPAGFYQSEIGTNLSYNIAKNIKIKTGMHYGYNPLTKRWENMYMAGIVIDF